MLVAFLLLHIPSAQIEVEVEVGRSAFNKAPSQIRAAEAGEAAAALPSESRASAAGTDGEGSAAAPGVQL